MQLMKKTLLIFTVLGFVIFSACKSDKKEAQLKNHLEVQNKTLTNQLATAEDSKDSLIYLMNDVYSGIELINEQETLLYNIKGEGDLDMQRQTLMENLANIQNDLKKKEELLEKYKSQLNDDNDKSKLLRQQVENLQEKLTKSETRVKDLLARVSALEAENTELKKDLATTQEQVRTVTIQKDSLTNETARQSTELKQNEADMNKVYYAIGTKNELKDNEILGKNNKVLQGNYNQNYFTQADKRFLTSINCMSKKAEVLSNQPADSYRFEDNDGKNKILVITDPERFWNASRYLVIKVD